MTTAREIMTPGVECIGAEVSIAQVAVMLTELGVGALPICGTDDRLKGVITDRDIVVKVISQGKDPARTKAGELAQHEVVTIGADYSVEEIFTTMKRHKVRRLPVIDNHRLVGIVALADVARALPDAKAGDLLEALSSDLPGADMQNLQPECPEEAGAPVPRDLPDQQASEEKDPLDPDMSRPATGGVTPAL